MSNPFLVVSSLIKSSGARFTERRERCRGPAVGSRTSQQAAVCLLIVDFVYVRVCSGSVLVRVLQLGTACGRGNCRLCAE